MPNLCVIPARALEDARLSARDLRALMAVGLYTNHAGKGVWASQTTMAARARMTRAQMNQALQRLATLGYVRITKRTHPSGARATSIIDILFDEAPGVPADGTGGVPKDGTGGVPTDGTETTQLNVPTTMLHRASVELDGDGRAALHTLATTARFPEALGAALFALHDGRTGTFSWAIISRALQDMVIAGAQVSQRALRRFCDGVLSPPDHPPGKKRGLDIAALTRKLDGNP